MLDLKYKTSNHGHNKQVFFLDQLKIWISLQELCVVEECLLGLGQGCYWVSQQQELLLIWFVLLYYWVDRLQEIYISCIVLGYKTSANSVLVLTIQISKREYSALWFSAPHVLIFLHSLFFYLFFFLLSICLISCLCLCLCIALPIGLFTFLSVCLSPVYTRHINLQVAHHFPPGLTEDRNICTIPMGL